MAFKKATLGVLVAFLFMSGCGPEPSADTNEDLVVSVNDYQITRDEFESEFKNSAYGAVNTLESRQNFLNALIDRKLILQYAQKEGFDKERNFLKSIEKFWEQSLLKIALDKKTIEIKSKITAIGWDAQRLEESKKMNDWMSELRRKARFTINDSALEDAAGKRGGR